MKNPDAVFSVSGFFLLIVISPLFFVRMIIGFLTFNIGAQSSVLCEKRWYNRVVGKILCGFSEENII